MTKQEKNKLKHLNTILKQGNCYHLSCEDCYPYRAGNCPYVIPLIHETTAETEVALKADIKKLIINDKYHCTIRHTKSAIGAYRCSIVIKQKWHFPKTYDYVWDSRFAGHMFAISNKYTNVVCQYFTQTKEEVQKEAEEFITRYIEPEEFKRESEMIVYKYGESK
jgi:hypothetical protein